MSNRCQLITILHLVLAALALASVPAAAQDQPAPPEDVFRYVAFDAGDALEIDWAVDDGAYMYRDAFGFASGDPAVRLGEPEFPDGEVHSDEFLGEQVVYRGYFFVSIPLKIDGDKPESLPLTIESRGCLDWGFCYVPQTWIETVALEPAADEPPKLDFNALTSGNGSDDVEFPPPEEVFFPDVLPIDGNTVEVIVRVEPGFYLYRHRMSVRALSDTVLVERLMLPDGELKTDEFFGEQEVYHDEVVGRVALLRTDGAATDVDIEIGYQGCAEGGLCYLPQTNVITVSLPETGAVADVTIPEDPEPMFNPAGAEIVSGAAADVAISTQPMLSEQGRLAAIITDSPLWVAAGLFFLAGLGLAFTPCVLPMVPILSGIIAGEGDDVTPARGFWLAFVYVMGMALVYTAAGIAAAALGLQLQAAFNQPWVLTLFALLFVVLSFGMFGAYDLQMPSSIQSKLATVSGGQKSGTAIGAFVMGALSALVVTACVAPALIAALTVMAQTGDMLRGGSALFAMSLGMGAPLLLVGAAQGQLLPKAGPWMIAIKGSFGFMFLGLAIWMLSRFLDGGIVMALWATLIFIGGVFMGGLTSLTSESTISQKLGKGFGLLAILYGLVLFLGALTGGTNPLKPLASVEFGGGDLVSTAEEEHLEFVRIKTVDDLDREIAAAAAAGRTAMLDFYADWCVSCVEMEEYTFVTAPVRAALENTVMLQADVTRNDAEDKELLARFGVFGPPTIIFFDESGEQLHGYEVVGFMKSEDFAAHVRRAFGLPARTAADELVTAR